MNVKPITLLAAAAVAAVTVASSLPVRAEVTELKVARQYGISYRSLRPREDQKLI